MFIYYFGDCNFFFGWIALTGNSQTEFLQHDNEWIKKTFSNCVLTGTLFVYFHKYPFACVLLFSGIVLFNVWENKMILIYDRCELNENMPNIF